MAEQLDSLATKRPLPEDAKDPPAPLNPPPCLKPHISPEPKPDPSMKSGQGESSRGGEKGGKVEEEPNASSGQEAEQSSQYKRLKFQGELYEVGDTVLIRESENSNMVARIEKIIKENGDPKHPKWPMVELTWFDCALIRRFYKKQDIVKEGVLQARELAYVGENEVFETDFVSKIYADLLEGKCKVWDIKAYDGRSGLGHTDFYTRAHYEIKNVRPPTLMSNRVEADQPFGLRVGTDVHLPAASEPSRPLH